MNNRNLLIQTIIMAVLLLVAILSAIALLSKVTGVAAGSLPDGIAYPTITIDHGNDCITTDIFVDYWDVDPDIWGDEWASENIVSYLQNATLDTIDGDESPTYGRAYWYLDHSAIDQVTVEVTSNLYHNELNNPSYTYVETFVFTMADIDPACPSLGNIEDVLLSLNESPNNYLSWTATASGQYLAQIGIAQDENGIWFCDEVVDVSIVGSTYANALDTLCQQEADAFNANATYLPLITR